MNEPTPPAWRRLDTFSFGDNREMANELAGLVLAGIKRATCSAVADGPSTHVGKLNVMLDGEGAPRAVLETIELTQQRFSEVDEAFAFGEGEGDRTLSFWRQAHRAFFERHGGFAQEMMLYCERFRLVERIDVPAD